MNVIGQSPWVGPRLYVFQRDARLHFGFGGQSKVERTLDRSADARIRADRQIEEFAEVGIRAPGPRSMESR